MLPNIPTEWLYPASLEEAAQVQRELAGRVSLSDELRSVRTIVGTDVSNNLYDPEKQVYAAMVHLNYPSLQVFETSNIREQAKFPYVPGFLGFRESPALVEAFQHLKQKPDLMLVDGHGISHPRGLGIASQLGVLLDCPTIGVAKSILVGTPEEELGQNPGDQVPLIWKGNVIGAVLRTKARVKPLYISTGHKISLPTAVEWVMKCVKGYRLPEPTRQAHLAANAYRKANLEKHAPNLFNYGQV